MEKKLTDRERIEVGEYTHFHLSRRECDGSRCDIIPEERRRLPVSCRSMLEVLRGASVAGDFPVKGEIIVFPNKKKLVISLGEYELMLFAEDAKERKVSQ